MAGAAGAAEAPLFFDDFSQPDTAALQAHGWVLRDAAGHPGVPGARWRPEALSLLPDPAQPGNRLLQLRAQTDGTPAGTVQAQLCQPRFALNGTYASRVLFTDEPVSGDSGDPVIQAAFAVAPLAHAYDPRFSEIDWEYLPQGGWGSPQRRLYAIAWQTVRIEPWDAHNTLAELRGSHAGWRQLTVQVADGRSRWFVDGRQVAEHGGRNHPVQPMGLAFSLWFSPSGLRAPTAQPRVWEQQVDWVLHAPDRVLSPAQAAALVAEQRAAGRTRVHTVAAGAPTRCDF